MLIINRSFQEAKFPTSEKLAIVLPHLKKPGLDTDEFSSYRGVSHLSFLSKGLEREMLDQLQPLLTANNVIPSVQSGYRPHHSTETALCRIYNDLVINTCQGKQSLLVLLDLSSAFDTVDHNILLQDLHRCGLRGKAHQLMRSYLSDRYQRVQVGESLSSPQLLRWGVPQGSVLGPVLFSIYISPITNVLSRHNVQYHMYADDMQVYFSIEIADDTFDTRVDVIMRDIKEFLDFRLLKLNEEKTEIILIRGNRRSGIVTDYTFNILGKNIKSKTSVKNLGVIFDDDLDFCSQINSTVAKCGYHIRNLYAIKKFIDRDTLIMLVTAQILSRVDFCNVLYFGQHNYLKNKLQTILNRAARLVFGLPPRTPTSDVIRSLNWLPFESRVVYKICLMVFKILHFGQPNYLRELICVIPPNRGLRSSDHLTLVEPLQVPGAPFIERAFAFNAPRLFNKLPPMVRESPSVGVFKSRLKTFLFRETYSS